MFSAFYAFYVLRFESLFFWFIESCHHLLLNLRFSSFLLSLFRFLIEMARTKTTSNRPPSVDYKTLYHWAPEELLDETSKISSIKDIKAYKESESYEKFRIFGREYDAYVSVQPCKEGEPIFVDDRTSPEELFFFMNSTIFKRIKLRLPLTGFELALLTEVNVAPVQLYPNSWATLSGRLLVLLRGEESWQETMVEF